MNPVARCTNQQNTPPLAPNAILIEWACKILDSAPGLTRNQRQVLHDIKRGRGNIERTAVARLLELAPFASVSAATFGAEAIRGSIIGQMDLAAIPAVSEAYRVEEDVNALTNVRQQCFREARSVSTAEDVCEAFDMQAFASRVAADSTWRAISRGRSVHVLSR